MKSKISFINAGILRNDMKSLGWIGVAYLLGLLLSVPLQIFMIYSRHETMVMNALNNPYLRIFKFQSELQMLLLLVVPVLTGIFLFRYLQSSQTVDMMHTLPIKREILYNTHLTAGLIFLFIPIIIAALVSWAILNGLGIEYVSNQAVFTWLGVSLVINLLLFITSVAVGMFCGMSTVQGVLTYILLLLPTGLFMLLMHNINFYIYGFAYEFYLNKFNNISPLIRMTELTFHPFTGTEIGLYLFSSLVLYLAGLYLYQQRQLETAGNAIVFKIIRPIFKYGVTFCSMLLVGSYFNNIQHSMNWTYFGYILGSLLGYWLSEFLMNKSLHVFKKRTASGFLVFALVMIVLIGGLGYDFTGYEKKLPELAQVESVYWNNSSFNLPGTERAQAAYDDQSPSEVYTRKVSMEYFNPQNIANIYKLHQSIIANREQEKAVAFSNNGDNPRQNSYFIYKLKNGSMIYRQYNITLNQYVAQLKPIYESLERKKMVNDILHIWPGNVDVVNIYANNVNKRVKITDPALVRQAITALQSDVKSQTYEELTDNKPPWAHINVLLSNKQRFDLDWQKSYVNFGNWLQEAGEYNNARIIPAEDIQYAIIEKGVSGAEDYRDKYEAMDTKDYLADIDKRGGYLKITDPQQIETCLNMYIDKYDQQPYKVLFILNDGNALGGGFSENNIPDLVKQYFAQK